MPALKNAKQEHLAQELAKGKPAQTPTIDVRDEKGRFLAGNSGNGGRRPGSRNKLAQDFIDTAYKLWKEGGEQALLEVMLKQPAKFCALIAQLIPQHFKFEHEHTVMALSSEEVRLRLAEVRGKLLDAGIDLEALPVVEALPIEVWRRLTQASDHPGTRLSPLRWTSLLRFPTVL